MAIVQIGPASAVPAAAPALSGAAAVRADAGMTVDGMRGMIAVARDFLQLWREAEPIMSMLRPPQVEVEPAEPVFRGPPARAPSPEAARELSSAPPASEVDAARREEAALKAEKAREELRALVEKRLSKANILQLAGAFGPLALAEKFPKLADALAAHAGETDTFLSAFSEDELRGILVEVLPLIPSKDLPMVRAGLGQAVDALEKEAAAAAAPPPVEPAPAADAPKEGEGA